MELSPPTTKHLPPRRGRLFVLAGAMAAAFLLTGIVVFGFEEPRPPPVAVIPPAPTPPPVEPEPEPETLAEPEPEPETEAAPIPPPKERNLPKRLKPAVGKLEVKVSPWARVYLDGVFRGVTPIKPISLAPGEHTLILVNETLDVRQTHTVKVEANKTRELKYVLTRKE